jgi:hypothetical protein
MITLFDLIRWLAMVVSAVVLAAFGWGQFGILGGLIGFPLGLILGWLLGRIPLTVGLQLIAFRLDRLTIDELVAELHHVDCPTPNLHLLELKRRGYDVLRELSVVHTLLTSTDMNRRGKGWAAIISAFPDCVETIAGYDPCATALDCQEKCKALPISTEPSREPEPQITRVLES